MPGDATIQRLLCFIGKCALCYKKSLAFLLWLRFRLFLLAHPYRIWADSGLCKNEMVLIG